MYERKDMDNNYKSFELISINAALAERQVTDKILLCNQDTKKYGLLLTEQQALDAIQKEDFV